MNLAIETGRLHQSQLLMKKNIQVEQAEKAAEPITVLQPEANGQQSAPRYDEYFSSADQKPDRSAGIYELTVGEDGEPKIKFENPEDWAADKDKQADDNTKPEILKCTSSTEKIDVEIKKLQEKQQKIQQEIKQNANNPEKRAALEQQLTVLDAEIKTKSSDSYQKQNATYTFSKG